MESLFKILPEINFAELKIVNHSENVLNTGDRKSHTQNIEAFWSIYNLKLKKNRNTRFISNYADYFGEIIFRKFYRENILI